MSNFKTGDILKCVSNSGMPMLELGGMYKFIRYAQGRSLIVVLHDGDEQCYLISRFTKSTEEKKVDTIQLTYTEAWEALKEGKKVFYLGRNLELKDDLIVEGSHIFAFHNTARPFTMKKEPEYEVLGLHDNVVEIEIFGIKAYLRKDFTSRFYIDNDGFVQCADSLNPIGRVKFKGDYTKAKIKVTVDKDGNVTYEHLS